MTIRSWKFKYLVLNLFLLLGTGTGYYFSSFFFLDPDQDFSNPDLDSGRRALFGSWQKDLDPKHRSVDSFFVKIYLRPIWTGKTVTQNCYAKLFDFAKIFVQKNVCPRSRWQCWHLVQYQYRYLHDLTTRTLTINLKASHRLLRNSSKKVPYPSVLSFYISKSNIFKLGVREVVVYACPHGAQVEGFELKNGVKKFRDPVPLNWGVFCFISFLTFEFVGELHFLPVFMLTTGLPNGRVMLCSCIFPPGGCCVVVYSAVK